MSAARKCPEDNGRRYGLLRPLPILVVVVGMLIPCASSSAAPGNESFFSRLTNAKELRGAKDASDASVKRREDERKSAASVRERTESRSMHRGLDREKAEQLGREKFPAVFSEPVWEPLELRAGQTVERYVNEQTARIVDQQGRRTVVTSSLPMVTVPADAATPKPVSLEVDEGEAGFAPENALAPVTFGRTAADAVMLDDSRLSLGPGGDADRVGALTHDRVFYPSVQTDTDFVVMPVAVGAEVFWILRSPAAPESLRLRVNAPPGTVVRSAGRDGESAGVEIVRGTEVLSNILPPRASDADGQPVPVSMTVEGSDIVLSVRHRDADLMYPLAIDPVITEEYHATGWSDERGTEHGNLLWYNSNASFESGTANWTVGSGQMGDYNLQPLVHGQRHFSARRPPGSGDGYMWYDSARVPVTPGFVYKGSFYARPEPGVSQARFRPEILFFDQNGAFISHTFGALVTEQPGGSTWQASSKLHVAAPSNARSAVLRMAWEGARDGQWHNADLASLEDTTNWSEGTGWTREDQFGPVTGAETGSFSMPFNADYPFYGPGLYVGARAGQSYFAGQGAMWAWRAPADTHIRRLALWNLVHNFDNSYVFHGVARDIPRTDGSLWQSIQTENSELPWDPNNPNSQTRRHPSDGGLLPHAAETQDNKFAVFGLATTASGPRTRGAIAYLQDISIELGDDFAPDAPTVLAHPDITPGVWTNARTGRVDVQGRDRGLGLYDLWLDGDRSDGPRVTERNGVCGDRHYQCARDWTGPLYYTRNNEPIAEGTHTFRAHTIDAVDNSRDSSEWTIKIDRTRPAAPADFNGQRNAATQEASVTWVDAGDELSGTASYRVRYRREGAASFSAWSNTPNAEVDVGIVTANEQVAVEAETVDAAGNVSAVGASTVPIDVDTMPPSLSLADADAVYSDSEDKTLLEWAPAVDPDLASGSPSDGIAGYNIRYRRSGSEWTEWTTTELPRLIVTGGRADESFDLEVSPYDGSNNTGTIQSATVQAVAYGGAIALGCAPTDDGLPASCNDTAENEPDGGGRATLELQPNPAERTALATGLSRYRITVDGTWTTARLRHGSYVIGNVKDGWTLDRVGEAINGYYFGTIRGGFQGCGWIAANLLGGGSYASNGTSNCKNEGSRLPLLSSIATQVNPNPTDGSPTELKRNQVDGVRFCAYLRPSVDNVQRQHKCSSVSKVVTYDQLKDGYGLKWRYVVRGGQWVMVRDKTSQSGGFGTINWWFVRRSAFGRLCKRLSSPFVGAEQACST